MKATHKTCIIGYFSEQETALKNLLFTGEIAIPYLNKYQYAYKLIKAKL